MYREKGILKRLLNITELSMIALLYHVADVALGSFFRFNDVFYDTWSKTTRI